MSSTILLKEVSEETLILQLSRGNLDAFNHLVEAYQDIAYHHAWTYVKDQDLAEDVTQESFIKAYKSIERFYGGSFRSWILRIVTNTSIDFLRRRKRRLTKPLIPENPDGSENESPNWLIDPSLSVEATVEKEEQASEIYRMLDELPEIYRRPLTLIDIYDFNYKEAAEVLNIKVGTVKSRVRRARLQMREKLIGNPNYQLSGNLDERSPSPPTKRNKIAAQSDPARCRVFA